MDLPLVIAGHLTGAILLFLRTLHGNDLLPFMSFHDQILPSCCFHGQIGLTRLPRLFVSRCFISKVLTHDGQERLSPDISYDASCLGTASVMAVMSFGKRSCSSTSHAAAAPGGFRQNTLCHTCCVIRCANSCTRD